MRLIDQLSESKIKSISSPGFYADGGGLYLQVGKGDARSWIYRYMLNGKSRDMGLGSLHDVNLKQARTRVGEFRALRAKGVDPIEAREKFKAEAKLAADRSMTFKQCAEAYIAAYRVIELL